MSIKKILFYIITALFTLAVLTACNSNTGKPDPDGNTNISIVATTFPQYDWVRQILGQHLEHAELTLLLDDGVDLHSFQPTVEDISKIANCDLFIYVGGESDFWVQDTLKNISNEKMIIINLMEVLGEDVKEEAIIDGMEPENDEPETHEHTTYISEADEHVWLSLKNARLFCSHILKKLTELDSQNADDYVANTKSYQEKLSTLDTKYELAIRNAAYDTLLFGDRFPFRYLTDDYGLDYYAAFPGCSPETEASFETIAFLSSKLNDLHLPSVIAIEGSDQSVANTIIQNTDNKDQRILVLDSMQSVTPTHISEGYTYLSTMENNLEVLKNALN